MLHMPSCALVYLLYSETILPIRPPGEVADEKDRRLRLEVSQWSSSARRSPCLLADEIWTFQRAEIGQPLSRQSQIGGIIDEKREPTHFQLRKFEATVEEMKVNDHCSRYMERNLHARSTSANECHSRWECKLTFRRKVQTIALQVGIDTRKMSVSDRVGKWLEPSLRLPFVCIRSP